VDLESHVGMRPSIDSRRLVTLHSKECPCPKLPAVPQVEAAKATVRRMLQRLSMGDVAGFTNHLSPDYIRHSLAMGICSCPERLQPSNLRDSDFPSISCHCGLRSAELRSRLPQCLSQRPNQRPSSQPATSRSNNFERVAAADRAAGGRRGAQPRGTHECRTWIRASPTPLA
jgi:hypothetical protein